MWWSGGDDDKDSNMGGELLGYPALFYLNVITVIRKVVAVFKKLRGR